MYRSLYVHVSVCLCVHMCMYTVSVNVCVWLQDYDPDNDIRKNY